MVSVSALKSVAAFEDCWSGLTELFASFDVSAKRALGSVVVVQLSID